LIAALLFADDTPLYASDFDIDSATDITPPLITPRHIDTLAIIDIIVSIDIAPH
jgi:hypothetical protein